MGRNQEKSWQCPPYSMSPTFRLGWQKECAIDEGWNFVKSQVGFSDIQKATNILLGKTPDLPRGKWPSVNTNRLKRNTREIIETLANIRPFWGYSTDNSAFTGEGNMLNKLTQAIYLECFVDRALRDSLQFSATGGVGFISPQYVRRFYGKGEGYFKFEALGRQRVLPVQLPDDKDYQEAYAVTIVRRFGVAKAHALFPDFQDKLKPTRESRYGFEYMGGSTGSIRGGSYRQTIDNGYNDLACDIFYTYILDLSINETGAPLKMGFEDKQIVPQGKKRPVTIQVPTPWSYTVPFIGQLIPKWDSEQQKMVTIEADESDCRIYPQRRLMISCEQALMYDGPGFDWHGMVPLVPLYMDDWVFSKSGLSIMRDGMELQSAIVQLERSMLRMANGRVNPSKQYDMGTDAKKLASRSAEAIDPYDPDVMIGVDGNVSQPAFGPLIPQWMTEWGNEVPALREAFMQAMDYQMGINDIESLAKMRLVGSDLTGLEKLIEAQGPVVMGVSRSMERSMRDLGEMFKYMVLQYMTTSRVIQYVGADGVTPATLDYQPNSIVPSHLPHEDKSLGPDQQPPVSAYSRTERAKFFAENLRFYILPHSLHEITQNQQKLIYLNLAQRGDVIDNETLCNALSVPNYGTLEGSTIMEKLQDQKRKEAIFAIEMQVMLQTEMQKYGLQPPGAPGGEPTPPQPPGGGEPPHEATGRPEGRPNSFKKPPSIHQKGISGNGRTVVSTS